MDVHYNELHYLSIVIFINIVMFKTEAAQYGEKQKLIHYSQTI
jgi:hypothetical protein